MEETERREATKEGRISRREEGEDARKRTRVEQTHRRGAAKARNDGNQGVGKRHANKTNNGRSATNMSPTIGANERLPKHKQTRGNEKGKKARTGESRQARKARRGEEKPSK